MLSLVFIALAFLLLSSIVAGYHTTLMYFGRMRSGEQIKKMPVLFFFQKFLQFFFGDKKWEGLFLVHSVSKHILRLCYAAVAILFLCLDPAFTGIWIAVGILGIIVLSLVTEIIFTFSAALNPNIYLHFFSPVLAFVIFCFAPLSMVFLKVVHTFATKEEIHNLPSAFKIKNKIQELLHDSEVGEQFDAHDKKLILSLALFKDRIAREVMVPRIGVLSLPADTTIRDAAEKFVLEGYSRIPIYRDSVDQITGVLLYKDILKVYTENDPSLLDKPIETIAKAILYTPETKKISHLLQEFRNKQIHLAIVVDEYGGTEGIVTIEDILEELVGEIADEHDIEETLYTILPNGELIVDARMSIIDIEKELDIFIPKSPDYDTVGGYVFHCSGAIPAKGWKLHHDDFDLEILNSNERSVDKIHIRPTKRKNPPI